jgi:hypothetical protein
MNEESGPENAASNPSDGHPKGQTPEPIDAIEATKPATEQQLRDVKREMNAFERSTLRWTRTTAGIGLVTAAFICLQWCEMRSGAKDTHDLAVAAGRQADIAQSRYAPWVGIDQPSVISTRPEYAWSPSLPYPTIYVATEFSVKNYGASPAFREDESIRFVTVTDKGGQPQSLRQACQIDAYRTPGQVTLQGDIGEMILPGAMKRFASSGNMMQDPQAMRDLKRIWITICIVYQDARARWHYSGYRYITTSGRADPVLFPNHPGWSYIPFTGASLTAASAD